MQKIEKYTHIVEFESEQSLPIYIRIYSIIFRKRITPSQIHIGKHNDNTYKASIEFTTSPSEAQLIGRQFNRLVGVSNVTVIKKNEQE